MPLNSYSYQKKNKKTSDSTLTRIGRISVKRSRQNKMNQNKSLLPTKLRSNEVSNQFNRSYYTACCFRITHFSHFSYLSDLESKKKRENHVSHTHINPSKKSRGNWILFANKSVITPSKVCHLCRRSKRMQHMRTTQNWMNEWMIHITTALFVANCSLESYE